MHINNYEHLTSTDLHESIFRSIVTDLQSFGKYVYPRGLECLEIENFNVSFNPYVRFFNFEDRKLNIDYIKREFLWYLKGDRYDLSICKYAKLWNEMISSDGGINSNYGQYIFNNVCKQFNNVIDTLKNDKDSRRAIITILNSSHLLGEGNKEIPCTCYLNFRIRDNKLNMSVHMRSQDACYGFGSDIPIFSFIQEMIFLKLKDVYKDLEYGSYYHNVDSFHLYKKHYVMFNNISKLDSKYSLVLCPKISSGKEVDDILNLHTYDLSYVAPKEYKFIKWLLTKEEEWNC